MLGLNITIISFNCYRNVASAFGNVESVSHVLSHHQSLHQELVNG